MEATQYRWRSRDDFSRDLCIYEITRSTDTFSFVVMIFQYSKVGDYQLFHDLFSDPSWDIHRGTDGQVSDDVKFCIGLWEELGLVGKYGSLQPIHIKPDPSRSPTVFHNTLENIMNMKYGCGHVKFEETPPLEYTPSKVVPLVLDVRMSDLEVEEAIMKGIEKSL
jgi:hypothetical protein